MKYIDSVGDTPGAMDVAPLDPEGRRNEILRALGRAAERFLRAERLEDTLHDAVGWLGRAAGVTRATVYLVRRSEEIVGGEVVAEWIDEGVAREMGAAAPADFQGGSAGLPRWRDALHGNRIASGTTASAPDDERRYLEGRGIRSSIALPVMVSEELDGVLLLTDHRRERTWSDCEREALHIGARIIGAALDRSRTRSLLAEVEARFDHMAEHISDVFFMTDARTHEVLYLSPSYEQVWGRSREETLRDPLAFVEAIIPEDRHLMMGDIELSAVGEGPRQRQFEYRIRRPDGAVRWIRNRVTVVPDEEGRPYRVAGICTDISEQRKLEEEVRRSHRIEAMGHLAAGIAHEINTPVQYIGGNIEFLEEGFVTLQNALRGYRALLEEAVTTGISADRAREIAAALDHSELDFVLDEAPRASEQALDGVRRVTEIVRAMRDFAQPGTGDRAPTDLNALVRNTATVARNEWKYVAGLEMDLDPQLPWIPCYGGEVGQALLNLLVNAARAIEDRRSSPRERSLGLITISTRTTPEGVEIRVRDSGTGIAPEIRDRIFDPFFTTRAVGKGSGQGLTFVHAVVVERHGGTISVESEVGVGTTFVLRLPGIVPSIDEAEAA